MNPPPDRAASTLITDARPVAGAFPGFVVLGELGKGGMGTVFLAEDTKLKRKVALKTLRAEYAALPADRERFEREARAAATVEHDNIVPVLHIGEALDGTPFIVMPLLKGESLEARLRRDPVVPLELLVRVGRDVCAALAAAHTAGLVHRDIKPANIWLDGDPTATDPAARVRRCKVLDFGLARQTGPTDSHLTGPGAVLGTPAYMPPEQARGETADLRADLYSLGATLYRMASGRLPFDAPTPLALLVAISVEEPAPVRELAPHLPLALAALIDQLLNKDRESRPQSAAEVAAALTALPTQPEMSDTLPPAHVTLGARPPAPNPLSTSAPQLLSAREAPPVSRSRAPLVAGLVLLALLVPLALWAGGAFRSKEQPKDDGSAKVKPNTDDGKPAPANPKPKPPDVTPKPVADPDRAAALYAFSLKGCATIDEKDGQVFSEAGLPKDAFRLNSFSLLEGTKVDAAKLAPLAQCRKLYTVGLSNTNAGDDALAHLAGSASLTYLYAENAPITNAGARHIGSCTGLLELNLSGTEIDDTGLLHLHTCDKLNFLGLNNTFVTEAGVRAYLKVAPLCKVEYANLRKK
jgi:eukaryotic-like serine/threonine-protein kinase